MKTGTTAPPRWTAAWRAGLSARRRSRRSQTKDGAWFMYPIGERFCARDVGQSQEILRPHAICTRRLYAPAPVSSHPGLYSRPRYLFASAKLVILGPAESNSKRRPPSRRETAPRLNASEIG